MLCLLGVKLDAFTCSFVLKACVVLCDVKTGRIVHGFVEKLGFGSNLYLKNMILNFYAQCGDMSGAMLLFDKMPERDVVTWNIVMTQLVKRGDVDGAYGCFLKMPVRNVRSWKVMISGFVQCGKPKDANAISLFLKLEEQGMGVRPNEVTVASVLAACADLADLDLGRRVHEYANKSGFMKNIHVCNTLIDMYFKCGWRMLREVLRGMEQLTVVSWSGMIAGLAMHGQAKEETY